MKKIILTLLVICFLSVLGTAQQHAGISFEENLSWQQIKEKARTENKYIFVDCFATWCGPCKLMDQKVYPNDTIGRFMNDKFLSVKMQFDTSKADNDAVKARYADAHQLLASYQITAFPTFLFFSPDGKLVHKGLGFLPLKDFLQLVQDATDPQKQYYTLVNSFRKGDMSYRGMPAFIMWARLFNDQKLADSALKRYVVNYLFKDGWDSIYTRVNMGFILDYTQSSSAETFSFLMQNKARVDSVMKIKNIAQGRIDAIIKNEEIVKHLYNDEGKALSKSPDWADIMGNIQTKYQRDSQYADSLVYPYIVSFHYFNKDWPNFSKDIDLAIKKHQPNAKSSTFNYSVASTIDGAWYQGNDPHGLNEMAFDLFQGCADLKLLKNALNWSNLAIRLYGDKRDYELAEFYDTKANLLYKLGQKQAAISLEQKAINIWPKATDIIENLEKMKKGLPTWSIAPANK